MQNNNKGNLFSFIFKKFVNLETMNVYMSIQDKIVFDHLTISISHVWLEVKRLLSFKLC